MTRPGGSARDVAALVARNPQWIGAISLSPNDIEVTFVGRGESYAAWSARVADPGLAPIVIRVARRAGRQVTAPPEHESAALALAPPGLGPVPIHLGADLAADLGAEAGGDRSARDDEHYAYLVESFVPGRVLSAERWADVGLLAAHACTLARLHVRRWSGAGPVTSADTNGGGVSFAAEVDGVIAHWTPLVAGSVHASEFDRLAGRMRAYAADVEPDFAALDSFALLHGDPVMTNIVVSREPTLVRGSPEACGPQWVTRLVDWEWARIGDPARDLGLIGGAVYGHPWYAPLAEDLVEGFLDAYLDEARALGTDLALLGSRPALRRRRDAWLAAEAFGALAYVRRLGVDAPADARHTRAAAELSASLTAWLHRPG